MSSGPAKPSHRWPQPQTALAVIGAGLVLQGLMFFAFAEPLTRQIFPGAGDEALHVGMVMRRSLAALSFLAGLVVFLVRRESDRVAKRVLFGCGIGFSAMAAWMGKLMMDKAAVIPVPGMIIYMIAGVSALYLAFRRAG
jgi:hypothetical protein